MSNDDKPAATPEERMAALLEQARATAAEAAAIVNSTPDTLPVPAVGGAAGAPAEHSKRKMVELRASAMKKANEVKALQDQMRAELEAQMRAMNEIMAPLKQKVSQMNEAVWTIDLYLGRDEQIVTLSTGAPADPNTPLTLRQEVLSMDEETAAHAEAGGIDARNLDVFDRWICQRENLARILPEERGVVVLVPRKRGRDYGDPWMDKALNEENKWSYFLIRNGENLYRMRTDFVVGKHLIPATDEFTGLFVQKRWGTDEPVQIYPGTREWDKAVERQGAKQRHFMRMALVLQGLVDRTTVFQPLPDGGLNLLDTRTYDEGRAHLLRDAEAVLTDGRPLFKDWLAGLTDQLRVGMRIMGAFNTETFRTAGEEWSEGREYSPNNRLTPRARNQYDVDRPETGTLYQLEGRAEMYGERGFYFKFARTTERWMGTGYDAELRAPKTKGKCVILPGDQFILPFDLVTVEDMQYYLRSRRQRSSYAQMFPLLNAAIEAKQAEAEAEAPFRTLLAGQIVQAHDVELAEAESALDGLVRWWKLKNRWHRPLVPTPEHPVDQGKAIRDIVEEFGALRRSAEQATADEQVEREVVAKLLKRDPKIMVIGRTRAGGYLAFSPQARRHDSGLVSDRLWVVEYTTSATGRTIKARDWVAPGTRIDNTRVLHTTEAWEKWDVHSTADSDLTDDELEALAEYAAVVAPSEQSKGWPYLRGWQRNLVRSTARDVLVLGVTADRANQSITAWLAPASEPRGLRTPGTALVPNPVSSEYGFVRFSWQKKRGEVTTSPLTEWDERWERRVYGGTPERPWGKVYDGKSRDPRAVLQFERSQEIVAKRAEAIEEHNKRSAALRDPARSALQTLWQGHRAQLEATAYAQFLEDYADPDLWEGHRKTIGRQLEPSWHHQGRAMDKLGVLLQALWTLTDAGVSFEGHTVRSAIAAAGLEHGGAGSTDLLTELLDLPIHAEKD
jgi:hypothetical protein